MFYPEAVNTGLNVLFSADWTDKKIKNKSHHTHSNSSECLEEFIHTGVGRGFQDEVGGATQAGAVWTDGWMDVSETGESEREVDCQRGLKDMPQQK